MNRNTILAFGSIGAAAWAGHAYLEKQRKEALDRHCGIRKALDRQREALDCELEADKSKTARKFEHVPEAGKIRIAKSLEQIPGAEAKRLAQIARDQVEENK